MQTCLTVNTSQSISKFSHAHTFMLKVCNPDLVVIPFINPLIRILYSVLNLVNRHIFQNKDGLAESPPDASYV